MLDIQGLSKKYGDYLAVDHVSFTGMKVESEFRKWKHIAWRRKRFLPMFRNCRQCSTH